MCVCVCVCVCVCEREGVASSRIFALHRRECLADIYMHAELCLCGTADYPPSPSPSPGTGADTAGELDSVAAGFGGIAAVVVTVAMILVAYKKHRRSRDDLGDLAPRSFEKQALLGSYGKAYGNAPPLENQNASFNKCVLMLQLRAPVSPPSPSLPPLKVLRISPGWHGSCGQPFCWQP